MKIKHLSMISLVIWSFLSFSAITFGIDVSKLFRDNAAAIVRENYYKVDIEDVNIVNQKDYVIKNQYQLEFDILPVLDSDAGLQFESLDTSIFTVTESGVIKGIKSGEAILKITSSRDKDFSKKINLNFITAYPDAMTFDISNYYNSTLEAYVGIPIYFNCSFKNATNKYSETSVQYIYDNEYFTKVSDIKYIPNKVCDDTIIKCVMENGLESIIHIKIKEYETSDIVDVTINDKKEDLLFNVGQSSNISFLNQNGEKVLTDFTITISDNSIIDISKYDKLSFKAAGTATVIIETESGFKKELEISIRNVINQPIIADSYFNNDGFIVVKQYETLVISYSFPSGTTYKNVQIETDNQNIFTVSNEKTNSFEIYGNDKGTGTIKLIIDDGFTKEELVLDISVQYNSNISPTLDKIMKLFNKGLGHMGLFFVEALLALWMLYYYRTDKSWLNICIFLGIGLFLGGLTEFVQIFIPNRSAKFTDILIDMSGYLLGFILVYIIYFIKKSRCKNKTGF